MNFSERLQTLEREQRPIRVAVIGAGQMGAGLVAQIEGMAGMCVVALADIALPRCYAAYEAAGVDAAMVITESDIERHMLPAGKRLVTADWHVAVSLRDVDVVVDATGIPLVGARVATHAIVARKHVVMLNVEADVTIGRLLRHWAEQAGVVYTASAGDEYAAAKELYDFATALGFRVIVAGKGKNNALDRQATPDSVAALAAQKGMNPRMLASFVDGTKTMVEMTALANATGLVPDIPGMHGPMATVSDLAEVFRPVADGGIIEHPGAVDYAFGVAPGVFVVFTTDRPIVREELVYLGMGPGPYWALYRPYHLASLETPLSVARAVLYGEPTIVPRYQPVAETVTVAKRDLPVGHQIDGIGGADVFGLIETAAAARAAGHLPLGLCEGVTLRRDVAAGNYLTYADVVPAPDDYIWHLRAIQDELFAT
jgi:predicted homoserine dehydrogenase-like protein